jgi:hypothetical protein
MEAHQAASCGNRPGHISARSYLSSLARGRGQAGKSRFIAVNVVNGQRALTFLNGRGSSPLFAGQTLAWADFEPMAQACQNSVVPSVVALRLALKHRVEWAARCCCSSLVRAVMRSSTHFSRSGWIG